MKVSNVLLNIKIFLGHDARKVLIFQRNLLPPSSGQEGRSRFFCTT